MNFSLYVAKRYLFSKSSNNAINIITIISTIGVVVSAMSMFLVLSVFSGLKSFSSSLLNITDPEIRIVATEGKHFFFTKTIKDVLENTEGLIAYSKVIEERAFFKYDQKENIAYVKGIDRNYTKIVNIDSLIYEGNWIDFNTNTALVGNGIANKLSLGVLNYGEPLQIFVPKPGKKYITDPIRAFKKINTQVSGIFSVSEVLDNKYVFIPLEVSQRLLNYKTNQISAIDIKTKSEKRESSIHFLKNELGDNFKISSKEELNATFYKILNTEKLVAYLIFTLVLIIALFNVIGSIIMMILDKKENLKTLYRIGATIKDIKLIFVLQGVLLSIFGLTVGIIIGSILILLQNRFHLFMITQNISYPIELRLINILIVCITITMLAYAAVKIASSKISRNFVT